MPTLRTCHRVQPLRHSSYLPPRGDERLVCHVCGFQSIVPRLCPNCQDPAIRFQGYGTEKAETILRKVFPSAKIARLDTDTTRRKNTLRDTLRDFRAKKINILLGTQMIAKGLDFPNVTLVGVLNADLSLYAPDFRAGERTFQLLTQVAGRSGRGKMAGEVIIQTSTPHSPSITIRKDITILMDSLPKNLTSANNFNIHPLRTSLFS